MSGIGKLRPEVKDAWVAALRSGEYQQATAGLHVRREGLERYCCLGVLCNLAAQAGVTTASRTGDGLHMDMGYGGMFGMPPFEVQVWAYLERPDVDREWQVVEGDPLGIPTQQALAEINDAGADFAHIADLIEASL